MPEETIEWVVPAFSSVKKLRVHIRDTDPIKGRTRLVLCGQFRQQSGDMVKEATCEQIKNALMCLKCVTIADVRKADTK